MAILGLDFGTTNSILSFLDGENFQVFKYGNQHENYIPSFIAYHDDGYIDIGVAAKSGYANNRNLEAYGNFKMRLPILTEQFEQFFRNGRSPMSVTTDYLRELLIGNNSSFVQQYGEIEKIVVSIPEIWQRDVYYLGRNRLQEILKESLCLGDRLIQLVSEPVAAAAYYAWQIRKKEPLPFEGNVLVCDMGGGTFDVSVCRIYTNGKIEVLYFDGEGSRGLDSAGVAFDRTCVKIAYSKVHQGAFIDENTVEFRNLLRSFEETKISGHAATTRRLTNYLRDKASMANTNLYTFGGNYNVTCAEVENAFSAIAGGIENVMGRVSGWIQNNNTNFDRLFLVGGFSQFILVRNSIFRSLGIESDDNRIENRFNITDSTFAISYGACLIANGDVDPIERYAHGLGVVANYLSSDGSMQTRYVSIVAPNTAIIDLVQPCFAEGTVSLWRADQNPDVTLWVDPMGRGMKIPKTLPDSVRMPGVWSSHHRWRVGIRMDRLHILYLVVEEETNPNLRAEYELGNILAEMFPGFVLNEVG
jgi:molecular chaperone DnaK